MDLFSEHILLAFILSSVLSVLLPVMHIILLRLQSNVKSPILLTETFCCYVAMCWLCFGWLAGWTSITVFVVITSCAMQVFFLLGYMELFSMVCRGFSLRIMVDIDRHGRMTLQQIKDGYGGRGVQWMFAKRLETLTSLGLINADDTKITLKTPLAKTLGHIGNGFKGFLKMGKGG